MDGWHAIVQPLSIFHHCTVLPIRLQYGLDLNLYIYPGDLRSCIDRQLLLYYSTETKC